ncbi:MAG: ABC-F family ATP-binding cassette domain-containing protein [Acidimicrobiia bacterium]
MGAVEVSGAAYKIPGGVELFRDVSFRVGNGEHVALVGENGAGKSTLFAAIGGELPIAEGNIRVEGELRVMRQLVGWRDEERTVRDLLLSLSEPAVRRAGAALDEAEVANRRAPSDRSGLALARAHAEWGDAGGWDAEVLWDTCTTLAVRQPFSDAGERRLSTLSGGEQKRLALEVLLRSDAEVLLLDEPDNYLDVAGKEWLEDAIRDCAKAVLLISHDRALLARTSDKVVTLEGRTAWVHGASFATWHDARDERLARIDEEHRRWQEERGRLERSLQEFRRRAAMGSDKFASRVRATKTKIERFEAMAPTDRVREQAVSMRLGGDRSGKRVVICENLELHGAGVAEATEGERKPGATHERRLTDPFDTEIWFGERVAVLGPNGTGKSHFLRLLAGEAVDHEGAWRLGARVVPGYFSQTHDRPELRGVAVLDIVMKAGPDRGRAMAALRRYGLHGCARQSFETLSGGQQARLQVLLLELTGANLLLLDEPTDNLDLASADALEEALTAFVGTVVAVTHDRWFLRSFDRYLLFARDCAVTEHLEPVFT